MSYEVIARKYRPQQFKDVVGQEHVVRTLSNAIESGRVAHAYLFVGPRGIGKTTSARIFAKALNCKEGPTATPCDKCDSCIEIMAGRCMDVIEIDGASNNGVDQIRDLRDNAIYAPARDRHKIYIIDEVHMLSIAAFNALLKTLEEPPKHVKFIFATTDPQKVPNTILSRCQRFDLRRITMADIMGQLRKICETESVQIDEAALLAIARGAEGGMRDAESALDQLIAFCGSELSESDVLSVFGLVAQKTMEELAAAILGGDVPAIIRIIAELDQAGKDLQRLMMELIEYFRNLLVVMYAGDSAEGVYLAEAQLDTLREQAKSTDAERVLRVADILVETDGRMRYALSKRTLLETGLIRASRAATVVSVDTLLQQIADLKKNGIISDPAAAPSVKPSAAPEPQKKKRDELTFLKESWPEIIRRFGKADSVNESYLRDAAPVSVKGDHVTVAFDPEFGDERHRFENIRVHQHLNHVLSDALGRQVTADFELLGASAPAPEPAKTTVLPDMDPRRKWYEDPSVAKLIDTFNGSIIEVRE